MDIIRSRFSTIKIFSEERGGGQISSQSVEANLMFAILEKLEEIRRGLVDVETAVEDKNG